MGMEINSREYWDQRFSNGDWDRCAGMEQSAFFAKIAIDAFPLWMTESLGKNRFSVIDMGCAEGDGTVIFAKNFPLCIVKGVDFSDSAIARARERHPEISWSVGDIMDSIETDIIFCSNVLEHMKSPNVAMERIVGNAKHHAIFLLPFHDMTGHEEHVSLFDEENIPLKIKDHYLSYFRIIDCAFVHLPRFWEGEQLLCIYSNMEKYIPGEGTLKDLFSNEQYYFLSKQFFSLKNEKEMLLQKVISNFHQEFIFIGNDMPSETVKYTKKQEIENILLKKSNETGNAYSWIFPKESNSYTFIVSGIKAEFPEYSVGVYDWRNGRFLYQKVCKTWESSCFNFLVGEKIDQVGFLIYAGLVNHTEGNSMVIGKLSIRSRNSFGHQYQIMDGVWRWAPS